MKRALAGGESEQKGGRERQVGGALEDGPHRAARSGKKSAPPTSWADAFPPLTYGQQDADDLVLLEAAPRTVRGARDLLSVALQYGNAFGRGFQAAALKPADYFGNDDELYLMEDMATGEIRVSILWEWLHKQARFTADDAASGVKAGDPFTLAFFDRLMEEEYEKLRKAGNRDVHDDSKHTTLPIARAIVERYVKHPVKAPWCIDLLNLNLNNHDLGRARERIEAYFTAFERDGTRLTDNPDFAASEQV